MTNKTAEYFENQKALGERAVACKAWKWMPGMLGGTIGDWFRCYAQPDGLYWQGEPHGGWTKTKEDDWIPNLNDPGTKGCLLDLIRDASNDPWLYVYNRSRADGSETEWTTTISGRRFSAGSEQEVLIAMLEIL